MSKRFVGLDLSTKTGFVALDANGKFLEGKELSRQGKDPERMALLIDDVIDQIRFGDQIVIEGFGFASQQAIQMGGIGWGVRTALYRLGIPYLEVAPMALKKFCGATGNKGIDGKAIKADKIEVAKQVLKRWNFESGSDNVTDAYVLAQIARAYCLDLDLPSFQQEVIDTMKNNKSSKTKRDKKSSKKAV